ncbi:hypothetical protein RhiirC2_792081 [Rhizophagus irregularis]|uniref:Uncharacterized protein n=1 Tax=Rhizophagus irregularis TaxID=588596 RepID=A0A2N1MHY7_9GLOM|nr:hypothetical protein RhiirC2_792081 [Rhizophagus irregularis]
MDKYFKKYYNSFVTYFGLIILICLTGFITAVGVGRIELVFPVSSPFITQLPMMLTYVLLHLIMRIFTIGFAISTTTIPGSLSIKSEKFNADPLKPCAGEDGGCPALLQSKFRFQWLQGASDVMVNGISKQLSMHWGDLVDGERIVMVATTDNNTNTNYKLVQTEDEIIPAFSLNTMWYYTPETYPILGSYSFHDLNIPPPTPLFDLIQSIQANSGLEDRWMGEIIKLEQDNLNETTRITLNFVQILPINSSYKGIEIPVQLLIKGETGVRLEIRGGFWITILIMNILCFLGVVGWQCIKCIKQKRQIPNVSLEWLIFDAKDTENCIREDDGLIKYTSNNMFSPIS